MTVDAKARLRLGLPAWLLVVLALLGAPRAVLHDLGIADGSGMVPAVLAVVPAMVWIYVAERARVPFPLTTLLVVGGLYGVVLALVHNLLWSRAFTSEPALGGSFEGRLDPVTEELLLRAAASVSSLVTGLVVGLVCGLVAELVRKARRVRRS
jgi:hypothetical protein